MRWFIVVSCIWMLAALSAEAQEIMEQEPGVWKTRELKARAGLSAERSVLIRAATALQGTIAIQVGTTDDVAVTYTKLAKTDTRSMAIDYIDLISVSLDQLPNQTRVDLRAPNPAPWSRQMESGLVEAVIVVPEGARVEIDALYFDVDARGPLNTLLVPNSLGRMDVTDITARLELSTSNRRVSLERIRGLISVGTTNSSITAEEIESRGDQAKFRNEGGDIRIRRFTGAINLRNEFGRTSITEFRPQGQGNFIRSESGPVILEIAEMDDGQLVIQNRHEDIELLIPESLEAFFSLTVGDEGEIEATNFEFKTELVQRNRLNLIAGGGLAEISGTIRGSGNISVRGVRED